MTWHKSSHRRGTMGLFVCFDFILFFLIFGINSDKNSRITVNFQGIFGKNQGLFKDKSQNLEIQGVFKDWPIFQGVFKARANPVYAGSLLKEVWHQKTRKFLFCELDFLKNRSKVHLQSAPQARDRKISRGDEIHDVSANFSKLLQTARMRRQKSPLFGMTTYHTMWVVLQWNGNLSRHLGCDTVKR